jgi:hypothetical protein
MISLNASFLFFMENNSQLYTLCTDYMLYIIEILHWYQSYTLYTHYAFFIIKKILIIKTNKKYFSPIISILVSAWHVNIYRY